MDARSSLGGGSDCVSSSRGGRGLCKGMDLKRDLGEGGRGELVRAVPGWIVGGEKGGGGGGAQVV